jgi:hypothetical protein
VPRKAVLRVGVGSQSSNARRGLGPPPPGRPVSNIGSYLLKPTAEVNSGFEMINADPNVLRQVHQKYLKAGQLPPALQPKYIRKPEVLEQGVTGRAKNISRGWRKPRSHQG